MATILITKDESIIALEFEQAARGADPHLVETWVGLS
jgi:hypothetical protein